MTRSSLLNRPSGIAKKSLILGVLIADVILIIFSDLAAFTLRFGTDISHPPPTNFFAYLQISVLIIILKVACFYVFGLYYHMKAKTNFEIFTNVFRATATSMLITIVIAFYGRAFAYPRTVILISFILTTAFIILWRIVIQLLIGIVWKESNVNVLVIGTDKEAQRIGLHLTKDATTKNRLIGYIRLPSEPKNETCDTSLVLGSLHDLDAIVKQHTVDEIVIATNRISPSELSSISRTIAGKEMALRLLPGIYEALIVTIITSPSGIGNTLSGIAVSPIQATSNWYWGLKRIIDLACSVCVLCAFFPIMALVAVLIKTSSPGPVLFRQERVGINGKKFIMYKFRTMRENAEEGSGPVWASRNDPRITPLGRFLRLSRLDELPQLINVLRNDMSIVGPRPERPYFVEELMKEVPFYAERLSVKPGITGWAQVNYKYAETIEESKEKLLHDIFYIKNMSLALDIWIFLKTLWIIAQEKGAQ